MIREENADEGECGVKELGFTGRIHMVFGTSEVLREWGASHKTKKDGQRLRKATGKLINETKQCLRSRSVGVGRDTFMHRLLHFMCAKCKDACQEGVPSE